MRTAVDITLYPLEQQYQEPIEDFIRSLQEVAGLEVHTNDLATQISGDYDLIMNTLRDAMRKTFERGGTYSFVLKILNIQIEPGNTVVVA